MDIQDILLTEEQPTPASLPELETPAVPAEPTMVVPPATEIASETPMVYDEDPEVDMWFKDGFGELDKKPSVPPTEEFNKGLPLPGVSEVTPETEGWGWGGLKYATFIPKAGATGAVKLGVRLAGYAGMAMGYLMDLGDTGFEYISGREGIDDETLKEIQRGFTDADVNYGLELVGLAPETVGEEVASEMVSILGATAATSMVAPYLAGTMFMTRMAGVAPKVHRVITGLAPWVMNSVGAAIGSGDKTSIAAAVDAWDGSTKFQNWVDNEATQTQRLGLKFLDDFIVGNLMAKGISIGVAGGAWVTKGILKGFLSTTEGQMVKPALDQLFETVGSSVKKFYNEIADAYGSANQRIAAEKALLESVPPLLGETTETMVDPKVTMAPILKTLSRLAKSNPKETQVALLLDDALRMAKGELPVNLGQFQKYSNAESLAIEEATLLMKKNLLGTTPESTVSGEALDTVSIKGPWKGGVTVRPPSVPEITGDTTLLEARDKVLSNLPEPQISEVVLKEAGDLVGAAERQERLRLLNKLQRNLDVEITPSTTQVPAVAEPSELSVARQKFQRTMGDPQIGTRATPPVTISTVETPAVVPTEEAVEEATKKVIRKVKNTKASEVPAVEPQLTPPPRKAKGVTAAQTTEAGGRVVYREGFQNNSKAIKIGKHGTFVASTDQAADIVSVFSKQTPPTPADATYLKNTYNLSLDEAEKIYKTTYKKDISKIQKASGSGEAKILTEADKKITEGKFSQFLKSRRGGLPDVSQSPVLQYAISSAPQLVKALTRYSSNPWLVTTGALAADWMSDSVDLKTEDYLALFAGSLGVSIANDVYGRTFGLSNAKKIIGEIELRGADLLVDLQSKFNWARANGVAKELTLKIQDDILGKNLSHLSDAVERTFELKKDWVEPEKALSVLSKNTPQVIADGDAIGSSKLIHRGIFSSPTAVFMHVGRIVEGIRDAHRNVTLKPEGVTKVWQRYADWMEHWGISGGSGQGALESIHGNDPKAIQALMVAWDSVERYLVEDLVSIIKTNPTGEVTHSSFARLMQTMGGLRNIRDTLTNPELMIQGTNIGSEMFMRGSLLSVIPDDLAVKHGSDMMKDFHVKSSGLFRKLSSMISEDSLKGNATLPRGFYKELGNLLHQITSPEDLSGMAFGAIYNNMLSSVNTIAESGGGNVMGMGTLFTKEGIKTLLGLPKDAPREVIQAHVAGKQILRAIPSALSAAMQTLKTGVKTFDSTMQRPYHVNIGELTGYFAPDQESAKTTRAILTRAFKYLGHRIGVTPSNAMMALDVFPQIMSHALKQGKAKAAWAYDNALKYGSIEKALAYAETPEMNKKFSEEVLNATRAYYGLDALETQFNRGGTVVSEQGYLGQIVKKLGEVQKIPLFTAVHQFFSTAANVSQTGFQHTPLAILGDMLRGDGILRTTDDQLRAMTKEQRRLYDDAKLDLYARSLTGMLLAGALATTYEMAGEYIISPVESTDKTLRNISGYTTDMTTITADGTKRTFGAGGILGPTLMLANGVFKDNESDIYGGLLMESIVRSMTPTAVQDMIQTLNDVRMSTQGDAKKMLQFVEGSLLEAADKLATPSLLRSIEQHSAGYLQKSLGVAQRAEKFDVLGRTTPVEEPGIQMFRGSRVSKVKTDDFTLLLAENGIDIANPEEFTWKGTPVKDAGLRRKLFETMGRLMVDPGFGGGTALRSRLQSILSPELRRGEAKAFLSKARGEAMRLSTDDLDKYVEDQRWIK